MGSSCQSLAIAETPASHSTPQAPWRDENIKRQDLGGTRTLKKDNLLSCSYYLAYHGVPWWVDHKIIPLKIAIMYVLNLPYQAIQFYNITAIFHNRSNLDHIVSSGLKSRGLVIRVLDLDEEFSPVYLNIFE